MDVGPRFDTNCICIYVKYERKYYKLPPCISFMGRYELSDTPTKANKMYYSIEFADNSSSVYHFIDEASRSAPYWIVADTSNEYSAILFCDIVDYRQYDYNCRLILKTNGIDTWMACNFGLQELMEDLKMAEELIPYNNYSIKSNAIELMYISTDSKPLVNMPVISDIYYIAPYTTVKWMDGTTTTVKAGKDDEFNKEYGLAMAIAKKYYERLEAPNPRAAFKKAAYKDAHDQTEKTEQKRAYKEEKKKRNKHGRISSSKKTSKR